MNSEAQAGLEAATVAYAQAWLTGTPADIDDLQSPSCAQAIPATTLLSLRTGLQRFTGINPTEIKVTGALVRHYSGNAGEATPEFDLPQSRAGNENWISFSYQQGRWRATDCSKLPIGGQSESASSTAATSP